MTSEEVLLEKFKVLPTNRKQELLDFAEFLESKDRSKSRAAVFTVFSRI